MAALAGLASAPRKTGQLAAPRLRTAHRWLPCLPSKWQALDVRDNEGLEAAAGGQALRLRQLGADAGWLARSAAFLPRLLALAALHLKGGASSAQWDAVLEGLTQGLPQLAELTVYLEPNTELELAGPSPRRLEALEQARPTLRVAEVEWHHNWPHRNLMPPFDF